MTERYTNTEINERITHLEAITKDMVDLKIMKQLLDDRDRLVAALEKINKFPFKRNQDGTIDWMYQACRTAQIAEDLLKEYGNEV